MCYVNTGSLGVFYDALVRTAHSWDKTEPAIIEAVDSELWRLPLVVCILSFLSLVLVS